MRDLNNKTRKIRDVVKENLRRGENSSLPTKKAL